MSGTTKDREYINGVFMSKTWGNDDNSSIMGRIGIKKEEFIEQLMGIDEDERGFINLSFGTQKNDEKKFSLWKDDGGGRKQTAPAPTKQSYTSKVSAPPAGKGKVTGKAPTKKVEATEEEDDLPF